MNKRNGKLQVDKSTIKKYVDTQVKTLRQYGTKITKKQYNELVKKVEEAVSV